MTTVQITPELADRWISGYGICGCGNPELALLALRDTLRCLNDGTEGWQRLKELLPDTGMRELVLGSLQRGRDGWRRDLEFGEVIEHGTVIEYSWLTPVGLAVLARLEEISAIEERLIEYAEVDLHTIGEPS